MDGIKRQTSGDAAAFREDRKRFRKMAAAAIAVIAAFAIMQKSSGAKDRSVFDDTGAVVVDFISESTAMRAGKIPALKMEEDMSGIIKMFDISNNKVFYLQEFCDKIMIRHKNSPFCYFVVI